MFYMAATEPIRDKRVLKQMADYYYSKGRLRDYVLIVLGACTALRMSDLLPLRWDQVYDEARNELKRSLTLRERKTGKIKTIALNAQALSALKQYLPQRNSSFLFSNHRRSESPISRVHAWRIIRAAALAVGARGNIACHSLRKTWGYYAWRDKNISPVIIMHIYNHSSFEITRRYLGIQQDELDQAYLTMELF